MRLLISLLLTIVLCTNSFTQNDYYFPKGAQFDPAIPSPEQFLGYPIGEWHTRVDRIVAYFEKLAAVSNKAQFQIIGYSTEHRPQMVLTISDPANLNQLEDIRLKHLMLAQPNANVSGLDKMPAVVLLGYGVHGNEPSSAESAMLMAYYLLAEQSQETKDFLKNAIIHIDPVYNPDGRDRHSTWANMHKGNPLVSDPLDREHNEVWPGGRTNHYWFDLNRDWLPLTQKETRNRAAFYHKWLPNVMVDYHEMGTNATYFFEPTKPDGTENPLVPKANYAELNVLFGKHFEKALDEIGSLYYARESFDNLYPGYGSTYPDMQGGLGILFEQASSRGHVQQSETEDVTFAFTIRNQLRTGIATVRAANENRLKLLEYKRSFFQSAITDAAKGKAKAWLFGTPGDLTRSATFLDLLNRHQIKAYNLKSDLVQNGKSYKKGEFFVVPAAQPQYRMAHTLFEHFGTQRDSVFYDASSWVVALAYNLDYTALAVLPPVGDEVSATNVRRALEPVSKASYAYFISWSDHAAPKALYYLLQNKVNVKTAFKPFSAQVKGQKKQFGNGTLLISVADQKKNPEELWSLVQKASELAGVEVHTVSTGSSIEGPDLGSRNFRAVEKPKVAMLVGEGISGYEAGEVWYTLDNFAGLPVSKIDLVDADNVNLHDYNTLILVSGNYRMDDKAIAGLKDWAGLGNTLITLRTATKWAIDKKLVNEKLRQPDTKKDSLAGKRLDYITAQEVLGAKRIGGIILQTDLDNTHPLGFGFNGRPLPVYRNHDIFVEPGRGSFNTVAQYTEKPLLDGYIHPDNLKMVKNSASLLVSRTGRGRAIMFVDNPNFRGFWHGTNRLFLNAVFFGGLVSVPE